MCAIVAIQSSCGYMYISIGIATRPGRGARGWCPCNIFAKDWDTLIEK